METIELIELVEPHIRAILAKKRITRDDAVLLLLYKIAIELEEVNSNLSLLR